MFGLKSKKKPIEESGFVLVGEMVRHSDETLGEYSYFKVDKKMMRRLEVGTKIYAIVQKD